MRIRFVFAMMLLAVTTHAAPTVVLVNPVPPGKFPPIPVLPPASRNQEVEVRAFAGVGALVIPLFEKTITARLMETTPFARDESTWIGKIVGESDGLVLLTQEKDAIAGVIIRDDGTEYRIRDLGNGRHVLEAISGRGAPADEMSPEHALAKRPQPSLQVSQPCTADIDPIIDLLVLYTAPARQQAGGPNGMRALIRLAALETNVSFWQSDVKATVRVVHTEEVCDDDPPSLDEGLTMLQDPADGMYDVALPRRNEVGADAVLLIIEDGDDGGASRIMDSVSNDFESSAYSVVMRNYAAVSTYSFTHEIGHLMGARHEWTDDHTDMQPFHWNHGYMNLHPSSGNAWRTMMATSKQCESLADGCHRLLRWSDPNALLRKDSMGVGEPKPTDNHRALNLTAATVAKFRCHKSH